MRVPAYLPAIAVLAIALAPAPAVAQRTPATSRRILAAKTVYFDDQIGVVAVREKALAQLKKWRHFQIVDDRKQADLMFVFSANPSHGNYILLADGRTGRVNKEGTVDLDPVPCYFPGTPVRDAYLTVFDAQTGEALWTGSHIWGGLLTGFNSVGERLIKKLREETRK
jgi:hypothetical protein